MNDKIQLAAMGEHMAEQAAQPMCMAKRIEELEAQVRVMAGLLRDLREGAEIHLHNCTVCKNADGIANWTSKLERIDAALVGKLPEPRITKPARVWGARFRPGIPEQTIIEAAYRYAEHESSPEEKEAGKINFDLLMAAVHKIAPEGWQLVPVEPTTEMVEAYFAGKMEAQSCTHQQIARERVARDYRAMLAAAPKPEAK